MENKTFDNLQMSCSCDPGTNVGEAPKRAFHAHIRQKAANGSACCIHISLQAQHSQRRFCFERCGRCLFSKDLQRAKSGHQIGPGVPQSQSVTAPPEPTEPTKPTATANPIPNQHNTFTKNSTKLKRATPRLCLGLFDRICHPSTQRQVLPRESFC